MHKLIQKKTTQNKKSGFTLLIAIITTAMLLIVSFVVVNIALKQLILANAARESQYAFYAADAGTECAVYWDLVDSALSAFATTTPGSIRCNGQSIGVVGGLPVTNFLPGPRFSLIGGGGVGSRSIFQLNFPQTGGKVSCAIVEIIKDYDVGGNLITTIDSRGYNTCNTSALRRYERGIKLSY